MVLCTGTYVHMYVCTYVFIINKLCIGGTERVPADITQSMYIAMFYYAKTVLCVRTHIYIYIRIYVYISLSTIVLNSRDW